MKTEGTGNAQKGKRRTLKLNILTQVDRILVTIWRPSGFEGGPQIERGRPKSLVLELTLRFFLCSVARILNHNGRIWGQVGSKIK